MSLVQQEKQAIIFIFNMLNTTIPPKIVFLYLTRECSWNCKHCYLDCKLAKSNELKTSEVKNILADLAKAGVTRVNFDGGDIFQRDDLEELVNAAFGLGLKISLVVNALSVNISRLKALQGKVDTISVSLDGGPEGSSHDWLRNMPAAYGVTESLIRIIKPLFKIRIWVTVYRRNHTDLHEILKWLEANNLEPDLLCFFSLSRLGRAGKNWDILSLDPLQYNQTIQELHHLTKVYKWATYEISTLPLLIYKKSSTSIGTCNLSRKETSYIDSDGFLYFCSFLMNNPLFSIGNLQKVSFADAWFSAQNWQRLESTIYPCPSGCEKCDVSQLCRGGCPAFRVSPEEKDQHCGQEQVPTCSQCFYGYSRQLSFPDIPSIGE